MAILREYLCALFKASPWYMEAVHKRFDFSRFATATSELCDALRDGISSLSGAINAVLPFKKNTQSKLVYRHFRDSLLNIVFKGSRAIVTAGMMAYFSIRVDILPRLRPTAPSFNSKTGNATLSFDHAARIFVFLPHLNKHQITPRLRAWVVSVVSTKFPGLKESGLQERVARWLKPTKSKSRKPAPEDPVVVMSSDITWLKADLCALCVHLCWPISGQATANIWNFVSRQPPTERRFVAPLTRPCLGGIDNATAATIQSIFLSDPVDLRPKLIAKRFAAVNLWDARVLAWWAMHLGTLNSIVLVARPACEVDSIRWEKWKVLKSVYGAKIGAQIVQVFLSSLSPLPLFFLCKKGAIG